MISDPTNVTLPDELEELPFAGRGGDGRLNFWMVEATGDVDSDVLRGVHYAGLAIDVARSLGSAMVVAQALYDMANRGQTGPVEIGFITAIASAAKAGG